MREYLKENVQLQFDGIERNEGYIGNILDKTSGETDTVITPGGIFILHGTGMKILSDAEHVDDVGLFYELVDDGSRVAELMTNIAQNSPRTVSALCGQSLISGGEYRIVIRTQAAVSGGVKSLKNVREIKSEFTVTIA
jgi:hypothetical protein